MSTSLILACLWALVANVLAMTPSKDMHWRKRLFPDRGGASRWWAMSTWQNGPWVGLLVLVAGMSILRWPVIYLGRWIKRSKGKGAS